MRKKKILHFLIQRALQSINSLIIQNVYIFKKKHCIHGRNGTRLKDDTLGAGVENASFLNFVNGEML